MKEKALFLTRYFAFIVVILCATVVLLSGNAIPSDRHSTLSTHMNTNVINDKEQFLEQREEVKFIGELVKGFFKDESLRFLDIGCGNNEFLNRLLDAFPKGNGNGVDIEYACGVDIEDAGRANHTTDSRFLFLNENIMRVASFIEDLSSGEKEKDLKQDGLMVQAATHMDKLQEKFNIIIINGDMVQLLKKLPSVVEALGRERCVVIIRPYTPNWSYNKNLNILDYCDLLTNRGFSLEIFGDANHVGKDFTVLAQELYRKFPHNFHNRFIRGYPSTHWGTGDFFIVLTREKIAQPDNAIISSEDTGEGNILSYQAA